MIQDALNNFDRILAETGYCDVMVLVLGGNDVAQFHGQVEKWAKKLMFVATKIWNNRIAGRVVILQSAPRVGPRAFWQSNTDFYTEDGFAREEGESMYVEKLQVFHDLLKSHVEGHQIFLTCPSKECIIR